MRLSEFSPSTPINSDDLAARLLEVSRRERVCILDSCGASHLGSRLMIAGVGDRESHEFRGYADATMSSLDSMLARDDVFAFFTISYEFGLKLHNIASRKAPSREPDAFVSLFSSIVIHDYDTGGTSVVGEPSDARRVLGLIENSREFRPAEGGICEVASDVSRDAYLERVERVREHIREGITYQTNLTQRLTAKPDSDAASIFARLRRDHPAPFAAFLRRPDSDVVSASPERFFRVTESTDGKRRISTSPIKGTRRRDGNPATDARIRRELLNSSKDRAENVMIVDLLRNDLGRVCEFGSVEVEKLCDVEEHPSLFHLVSTITGTLRENVTISDILRAVFPCGSITGAPKISTMRVIDELETSPRGLSMGAIGFAAGNGMIAGKFKSLLPLIDVSVAIRTMTLRDGVAEFGVGGGIVIDSVAADEYEETLTKAAALLGAIRGKYSPSGNKAR